VTVSGPAPSVWPPQNIRPWLRHGLRWILGALGALATATPGQAAEHLLISFGIFERAISIADLEHFATTGELTSQLRIYSQQFQLSEDQLQQVQEVLATPVTAITPVAVAQFLYTEQGVLLLEQMSRVVQTPARQANVQALRGALILAAADPDQGFTLLNVLKAYPTQAMRIDLRAGLAIAREINEAILQSTAAFDQVNALAAAKATANPVDAAAVLQLVQSTRRYGVEPIQVIVPGLPAPVQLYRPEPLPWGPRMPPQGFPLVVISHGLGGSSSSYTYLAEYLASGGIAAVAVEHAGSNDQQLYALLTGQSDAVVQDEEFLRRPQEISLTLNTLTRLTNTSSPLEGQLNLNRVGVVGQSFGGYTALALAGATFDMAGLRQVCPPSTLSFNPSLLLQCQVVRLGDPGTRLSDRRVRSILVMNPVGSALFGPTGYGRIAVPTFVVAGTADTIAPAFPEQIVPFTWLTTPNRHLLLINQGTHFSTIGDVAQGEQPVPIPPDIIGPRPELVWAYMQVLGLAYFKLTLEGDRRFEPALSAAFAIALSQAPYPLSLITTVTTDLPEPDPLEPHSPDPNPF
jgi:predicted dienelactone hydrolase